MKMLLIGLIIVGFFLSLLDSSFVAYLISNCCINSYQAVKEIAIEQAKTQVKNK